MSAQETLAMVLGLGLPVTVAVTAAITAAVHNRVGDRREARGWAAATAAARWEVAVSPQHSYRSYDQTAQLSESVLVSVRRIARRNGHERVLGDVLVARVRSEGVAGERFSQMLEDAHVEAAARAGLLNSSVVTS